MIDLIFEIQIFIVNFSDFELIHDIWFNYSETCPFSKTQRVQPSSIEGICE
ncbi:MAG: hypothetical protein WKF71_01060 [Pyrinomonadaceae bacterium]